MKVRRSLTPFIAAVVLLMLGSLLVVLNSRKQAAENVRTLADGTTLAIRQVTLTSSSFNYSHSSRGPIAKFFAPVLPEVILNRMPMSGGGFGFDPAGATNLILITHHEQPSTLSIWRLRVATDPTNQYDACWGAHTLGMPAETVNGWQLRAFPRRAPKLTFEFLAKEPDGAWAQAATFELKNPVWGTYPQWTAEPVPATKNDGNLAVTLAQFRSGATTEKGNPATAPRKTELLFTFDEYGKPTDDWRVQKVIISDATGNEWFPYLDLVKQRLNWARGGRAEFLGALWPGEDAWKLNVEIVRFKNFPSEDLFMVDIPLPPPNRVAQLTNRWTNRGVTVELKALASPETDHSGDHKWLAKWWGDDKDKVYSLVVELSPGRKENRLSLVTALDQANHAVELSGHIAQDASAQALFFKPSADSKTLRLTFALTPSRFVQFLARPEFVSDEATPDRELQPL